MTTRPPTDLLDGTITFILRLSIDESGRVTGVVERVRTGNKHRFHGLGTLGPLLAGLVASEPGLHTTDRAAEPGIAGTGG